MGVLSVNRASSLKHQQARRWLSPFIVTCSIYFLLWIPESQSTCVSALVKSLPVLSLVVYLWAVSSGGSYTWLLQAALVCSAVGDACLVWPETYLHGEWGAGDAVPRVLTGELSWYWGTILQYRGAP